MNQLGVTNWEDHIQDREAWEDFLLAANILEES